MADPAGATVCFQAGHIHYDDALDVVGVRMVAGLIGIVLIASSSALRSTSRASVAANWHWPWWPLLMRS